MVHKRTIVGGEGFDRKDVPLFYITNLAFPGSKVREFQINSFTKRIGRQHIFSFNDVIKAFERYEKGIKKGDISREDFKAMDFKVESLKIDPTLLKAGIRASQGRNVLLFRKLKSIAPFDGIVMYWSNGAERWLLPGGTATVKPEGTELNLFENEIFLPAVDRETARDTGALIPAPPIFFQSIEAKARGKVTSDEALLLQAVFWAKGKALNEFQRRNR